VFFGNKIFIKMSELSLHDNSKSLGIYKFLCHSIKVRKVFGFGFYPTIASKMKQSREINENLHSFVKYDVNEVIPICLPL